MMNDTLNYGRCGCFVFAWSVIVSRENSVAVRVNQQVEVHTLSRQPPAAQSAAVHGCCSLTTMCLVSRAGN